MTISITILIYYQNIALIFQNTDLFLFYDTIDSNVYLGIINCSPLII